MTLFKTLKVPIRISVVVIGAILYFPSCSADTASITLRYGYDQFLGKTNSYRWEINRAGEIYINDAKVEDFDVLIICDYSETPKEIRADGSTVVDELTKWNYRATNHLTEEIKTDSDFFELAVAISPPGEIIDFSPIGGSTDSSTIRQYREFFRQRSLVFPEYPVKIGDSWTRTTEVMLIDGSFDTTQTIHTFKGFTQKNGYNCAIIESRGRMILPVFANDGDSTQLCGQDITEYNEIVYLAHKEGLIFSSQERGRVISERSHISTVKNEIGPDSLKIELPPEKWKKVTITKRYEMEQSAECRLVEDTAAKL